MTTSITALRALLAAGTPGPWRYSLGEILQLSDGGQGYQLDYYPDCETIIGLDADDDRILGDNNAALITAAVNALPELLDEVERLREVKNAIRAERDALFEASMKLHHEEGPVRTELRMAKVETARLRALVEEACEIGLRWAFLLAEAGIPQDRTRLAAIRAEAKGAK